MSISHDNLFENCGNEGVWTRMDGGTGILVQDFESVKMVCRANIPDPDFC